MSGNPIVYSTDQGPVNWCTRCGRARDLCVCRQAKAGRQPAVPNDGLVRISRDRRNRKGKTVTVITGLPGGDERLATLTRELKQYCGTGGTVKDGVVEIQGDHRDRLAARLAELGYRVKVAGG